MPTFDGWQQVVVFSIALLTILANQFLSGVTLTEDHLKILAALASILGILFPTAPPTVAKIKALFD